MPFSSLSVPVFSHLSSFVCQFFISFLRAAPVTPNTWILTTFTMPSPAIIVENLSKLYRIGLAEQRSETLTGALGNFFRSPLRNFKNLRSLTGLGLEDGNSRDVIWALREVSIEVREGQVLGIIGANGAGKSTLLKVLAGITDPTVGRAVLRGRVASLLEVGTGFHGDLTGRENIYLNGTILGMKKVEIDQRFEEIVEFSGVRRFIDTPVKRYSSGMTVRLAFAVAAHLESEILLVDEVLAVGDLRFQEKCIGKMGEVARSGRTVLFVSHNLAAVKRLCPESVLLDGGRVAYSGTTGSVISAYRERIPTELERATRNSHELRVSGLSVVSPLGQDVSPHQGFSFIFVLRSSEPVASLSIRISMRNADDQLVAHCRIEDSTPHLSLAAGRYEFKVDYPPIWLTPGEYGIQVKVLGVGSTGHSLRTVSDPFILVVRDEGLSRNELPGILTPPVNWTWKSANRAEGAPGE